MTVGRWEGHVRSKYFNNYYSLYDMFEMDPPLSFLSSNTSYPPCLSVSLLRSIRISTSRQSLNQPDHRMPPIHVGFWNRSLA